jgi:16S rRNA (guanine527-N7)-methyltransferase
VTGVSRRRQGAPAHEGASESEPSGVPEHGVSSSDNEAPPDGTPPAGGPTSEVAPVPEAAPPPAARPDGGGGHVDLAALAAAGAADAAIVVYRELLARYHRTLDLVSPQAFADLDRHLAEAERYAAAVRELAPPDGPLLDLGTGAGLPGVVVAARLAPRPVWWVERRRRRTAFLTQVAAHAGLSSVRVVGEDVRRLSRPSGGVAAVTAQAVGTLVEVAELTRHLWGPRVLLLSRKGPDWGAEVEALADWWGRGAPRAAAAAGAQGSWASPRVLRAEALGTRGTLVAVELRGG